jgi:glycosyltransferase involved in cell wall biosynthesis
MLPWYRLALFNRLVTEHGFDLTVFAADENARHAAAEGTLHGQSLAFKVVHAPETSRQLPMWWQHAQWSAASPRISDVLVLNWNIRYASLPAAMTRAHRLGVPTIVWGHGYAKRQRDRLARLRVGLAKRADAVAVYDPVTANQLIKQYPTLSGRCFCLYNTIDQARITAARQAWEQDTSALRQFRAREGLNGRPVLVFTSRLLAGNRIEDLLNALHRLVQRMDVLLLIIGQGPMQEKLQTMTAALGLDEHVRFVGAIYDEFELAPWMLSGDLFVYPENIGLSLFHAMGYGLPVVTSDARALHNPEIAAFESGVHGMSYRSGDVAALADTLEQLLHAPQARQKMVQACAHQVGQAWTMQHMVNQFASMLTTVAGRSHVLSAAGEGRSQSA